VLITGGTGACASDPTVNYYWDIGVRGDTAPTNHSGGLLALSYSVITDVADYSAASLHNTGVNPTFVSQYCNGSRVPPELGSMGYQVPPGISDATVPNPIFTLTPAATVDEGNNWINISWGPLALVTPAGTNLGNYGPASTSSAIELVATNTSNWTAAPGTDFFGVNRKPNASTAIDAGAVKFGGVIPPPTLSGISPGSGERGHAVSVTITGTYLNPTTQITVSGGGVTVSGIKPAADGSSVTAVFTISPTASLLTNPRNVTVNTPGGAATLTGVFTVIAPSLTSIAPTQGVRGTTVAVTLTGVDFTGATGLTGQGGNINVTGFTVNSDTTITANLVISSGAATGVRNIAVVTPNGTTNTVGFTVNAPANTPSLSSINPTTGLRGTSVNVTLTGSHLTGATSVNVSGSGASAVTVSTFTVNSDTSISATLVIPSGAGFGNRNISVTTPSGTSGNVTFTVQGAAVSFLGPLPSLVTGTLGTRAGIIVVTNTGNLSLTLTAAPSIAKVGGATGTGSFSITGGTCANGSVLASLGSCTINVQYSGETNTSTANGSVSLGVSGPALTSPQTLSFNAN
jgi:hypothetical protein